MWMNRTLVKQAHRTAGLVVGTFILAHLSNHLIALLGVEAHLRTMEFFRKVYRHPVVETFLLVSIAIQITSGFFLAVTQKAKSFWDRIQKWSGLYLVFFFIMHLAGVLGLGREQLEIDTNIFFAATPLLTYPYKLFFIPYYGLAIVSLFAHGAAIHERWRAPGGKARAWSTGGIIIAGGIMAATLVVVTFSGGFFAISPPEEYRAMFD